MKTIEEKIKELANRVIQRNYTCNDFCAVEYTECQIYKDMLNALSEAAEYQKSIDTVQMVDKETIRK